METTHDNFDNEPFSLLLADQLFWKLCYGVFGYPFKRTVFNKTISSHEAPAAHTRSHLASNLRL